MQDRGARPDSIVLAVLTVATFLLLMIPNFNGAYGYFIDEFYYLACARRLAWGYVDHPPFAPLMLSLSTWLFGTSIPALRLLPAVAVSATVFLTGLMTRRLGGRTFAQALAALAVMFSPLMLIMGGIFTVNAFEILIWVTAVYILLRILQTGNSRLWLVFGLVAGLGLENKHTMAVFGMAVLVGLVLGPTRRYFLDGWFWLGGLVALALLVPNLVWESQNGWISLEFYRNASLYKNVPTAPLEVLLNQFLLNNAASLPVWLAGLCFYLFTDRGRQYRLFGWVYLVLLGVMLAAQSSRPDRISAAYPMLFAAGAVWWESVTGHRAWRRLRPVLASAIVFVGAIFAPLCLPVLSPERTAKHSAALGVVPQLERGKTSPLPQWLADRFDWEQMLETVAAIYRDLPLDEQKQAVIVAPSYGHAGAIELFQERYRLPHVISTHNNYYLWGMNEPTPQVLIAIGSREEELRGLYEQVEKVTNLEGTYSMNWRRNMPILVARKPKVVLREVWPRFKSFG